MYRANAVKLLIASPSDVAQERQIVRAVIYEWNAIHSEDKGTVVMPIGWETHSQPTMGDRPQAIINKQVLKGCDVLVAVFWTRLGSPTGAAASGTVEEIEEHVQAGKPAMLYFSSAPVRLESVDEVQYKALREFRTECEGRGLIETYDSLAEFREKFARQLAQLAIRDFPLGDAADAAAFVAKQAADGRTPILASLSRPSRELLLQTAEDKNGIVIRVLTMGGLGIQTNGRQFAERGNPRSEAEWDGALTQLRDLVLVQDLGHKGEVFKMTDAGYQIADLLRAS